MTRKDYAMLAEALNSEYRTAQTTDAKVAIHNVATALALKLKQDNERFDHTRFMNAVIYS